MKSFEKKTIFITGGSSGIGLATAKLLASKGADILLIARSPKKLETAKTDIEACRTNSDQRVNVLAVNVADNDDVDKKVKLAIEKIGVPDILINSAGVNNHVDHFQNLTSKGFHEVIDINLHGVINMTRALFEPMKEKKGHIVIISSAAALFGMFGYTAYAASKSALTGFTESLRYELKPLGMPVTIVFPPEVDTPMNLDELETLPDEGRAMKSMGGFQTPEYTAKVIVKAIIQKKYFVIPGLSTAFLYFLHRISNGFLSRIVSDAIVKRISGRKKVN